MTNKNDRDHRRLTMVFLFGIQQAATNIYPILTKIERLSGDDVGNKIKRPLPQR
jgi:hypothetical protein